MNQAWTEMTIATKVKVGLNRLVKETFGVPWMRDKSKRIILCVPMLLLEQSLAFITETERVSVAVVEIMETLGRWQLIDKRYTIFYNDRIELVVQLKRLGLKGATTTMRQESKWIIRVRGTRDESGWGERLVEDNTLHDLIRLVARVQRQVQLARAVKDIMDLGLL